MSNAESETLEQQVRDCLLHLYDYIFLQAHPLVRLLVPVATGDAHRVQAFRQMMVETIAALNPGSGSNLNARAVRIHNILVLRYIDQQPILFVLHRLNLSERQFYRDHARAIQTLSQVLSERLQDGPQQASVTPSMSIQTEIQRVQSAGQPQQIHAENFLERAIAAIQGLVDRHEAQVDLDSADHILEINTDPMVLRQAIIVLMSQLISQSPQGSQFRLSTRFDKQSCQFVFAHDLPSEETIDIPPEQWETLQTLMNTLGGKVTTSSGSKTAEFLLEIPFKRSRLLIVDDNPDAIALFRRHLAGQPYQVITAQEGNHAVQLAAENQPGVIILDVMLPQQDGWEVLQQLKSHPDTYQIPVLICTVLNAQDLALAVGADGFLRKPPGEVEFLTALSRFIHINWP